MGQRYKFLLIAASNATFFLYAYTKSWPFLNKKKKDLRDKNLPSPSINSLSSVAGAGIEPATS